MAHSWQKKSANGIKYNRHTCTLTIRGTVEARQGTILSRFQARAQIDSLFIQLQCTRSVINARNLHICRDRKVIANVRNNAVEEMQRCKKMVKTVNYEFVLLRTFNLSTKIFDNANMLCNATEQLHTSWVIIAISFFSVAQERYFVTVNMLVPQAFIEGAHITSANLKKSLSQGVANVRSRELFLWHFRSYRTCGMKICSNYRFPKSNTIDVAIRTALVLLNPSSLKVKAGMISENEKIVVSKWYKNYEL